MYSIAVDVMECVPGFCLLKQLQFYCYIHSSKGRTKSIHDSSWQPMKRKIIKKIGYMFAAKYTRECLMSCRVLSWHLRISEQYFFSSVPPSAVKRYTTYSIYIIDRASRVLLEKQLLRAQPFSFHRAVFLTARKEEEEKKGSNTFVKQFFDRWKQFADNIHTLF